MGAVARAESSRPVIAVLVLGPPASGKTTAVRTLVDGSSDVAHFKVREHFAHLLATGDPVAVAHRAELRRRDVLADAVVRYAFADFLRAHSADRVVLVEGYPRSAAQLADMRDTLVSHGGRVAGAVIFDARDAVLHARRAHRLVCPRCDDSGVRGRDTSCSRCGVDLVDRPDDELARFAARVSHFRTAGMEIAHLLAEADCVVVDASLAPRALADRLRAAIHRFGCSVDLKERPG
jgi:adenylate kinase family enzyme